MRPPIRLAVEAPAVGLGLSIEQMGLGVGQTVQKDTQASCNIKRDNSEELGTLETHNSDRETYMWMLQRCRSYDDETWPACKVEGPSGSGEKNNKNINILELWERFKRRRWRIEKRKKT